MLAEDPLHVVDQVVGVSDSQAANITPPLRGRIRPRKGDGRKGRRSLARRNTRDPEVGCRKRRGVVQVERGAVVTRKAVLELIHDTRRYGVGIFKDVDVRLGCIALSVVERKGSIIPAGSRLRRRSY